MHIKEEIVYTTLKEEDIDTVQDFMRKNWREQHPIANNRELFLWQYRGFGPSRGYNGFQLAFHNDKLIGFRAVIPQYFQVPSDHGLKKMICMASAMWMVDKDYRGLGLGYTLHNLTERISDISLAIGANHKTSVPIFLKSGYIEQKGLNRFIIPLIKNKYNSLVLDEKNNVDRVKTFDVETGNPMQPNLHHLEKVWLNVFQDYYAIHRNEEYWKWRYIDSPVFKYVFFGDQSIGFIVARIEDIYQSVTEKLEGFKILRIIEIIPANKEVLGGEVCADIENLLSQVLKWGLVNDCCAADFFCSNMFLSRTLTNVGFLNQNPIDDSINGLPSLFQPIETKPYLFNLYLRVEDPKDKLNFDFDRSYFVRSDTDQDRPNLIFNH